jgi:4-alpha-glucanotransferase
VSAVEESAGAERALARLASRYGIEADFWDARGEHVFTRPETQATLLRAMGVEAGTDQDAAAALSEAERAEAASPLPAVIVTRPQDGHCTVHIQARGGVRQVSWRVELEDGSERQGTAELGGEGAGEIHLPELPWGYHQLLVQELGASTRLIVTPGKCWLPDGFTEGAGLWGIAAQLYLLRSERDWGIGDFGDLRQLVRQAAERGCDVIGLNPLHQMFLDNPEHASPYSPLTRLYLNALYIAVRMCRSSPDRQRFNS